ncbi:DUF4238 domain-containing protein [Paraburkholderia graminis]|uniref:DUF4238 domain-containing protein n=1 Tax=Paraburkholderia graminis TaxID=60548 RepID=UPI0004A80407
MNRPRRHHFVPRFYLEGFCADDARALAVYDRVRNEYREQRPAQVAHRRDFYAYEDDQGNLVFDIERALGEVETAANNAIQRLENNAELRADDKIALATYVAFQFTRTPAYATWLGSFKEDWAQRARPEQIDALPEPPGPAAGREEAIGAMLGHAPRFAEVFLHLNWTIWDRESERVSFVTSDSPVCVVWANQPEPNAYAGAGILSPDVVTVLPLSQSLGLAMSRIGDRVDRKPLNRDEVRRVNLAVTNQAQHFVFGRDMALVRSVVNATGIDRRQWRVPLQVG